MNLRKVTEGLAIVCASTLFLATSEEKNWNSTFTIPYQHLRTNKDVIYQCDLGYGYGDNSIRFTFTNLNSTETTVHIAIKEDEAQDTGADSEEWEDVVSIDLDGTTPSDRESSTHLVDFGSSLEDRTHILLYGNPDEDIDIVIEGYASGLCEVSDISEEE